MLFFHLCLVLALVIAVHAFEIRSYSARRNVLKASVVEDYAE